MDWLDLMARLEALPKKSAANKLPEKNQIGHRWPEEAEASSPWQKFLEKLFLEAVSRSSGGAVCHTSAHQDLT